MQEAEGARGGGCNADIKKEAKLDTFRLIHRAFHVVFGLSLTVPKSKSSSLTTYRRRWMSLSLLLEEIFFEFCFCKKVESQKHVRLSSPSIVLIFTFIS